MTAWLCLAWLVALVVEVHALPLLLFLDRHHLESADPRLQLRLQQPVHGPWVLTPTKPWEAWAISAYNSVVAGNGTRPHRMYYGESQLLRVNVSPLGVITRTAAMYGLTLSVAVSHVRLRFGTPCASARLSCGKH